MTAYQTNLFDSNDEESAKNESKPLVIKSKETSKKSSQITKKIKRIESLKKKLTDTEEKIEVIKKAYETHLVPTEKKAFALKEAFVKKLYERWQQSGFAKWQTELIEDIMMDEIGSLEAQGYESAELNAIYNHIEESQDEVWRDLEEASKAMQGEEDEEDDEDDDFFDFEKEEEAFFKSFQEERFEQEKANLNKARKEKVLSTDKQFQKLYKYLVKKTHPDLVVDLKEKERREGLMKRLSEIWEARNYYELLLLKNEIEPNADTDISIDEVQSKSLLTQLDEVAREIQDKIKFVKEVHPESSFYYQNFHFTSANLLKQKIEKFRLRFVEEFNRIETYQKHLKTKASTKEFLKNSRHSFEETNQKSMEQLFAAFFGD